MTPKAVCGYCRAEYDTFEEAKACAWLRHGERPPADLIEKLRKLALGARPGDARGKVMLEAADRLSVMEEALREIRTESLLRPIDWPQPLARIHSIAHVALNRCGLVVIEEQHLAASVDDVEQVEQVISAWAFAHNIDGAARNDLFARLRKLAAVKLEGVGEP